MKKLLKSKDINEAGHNAYSEEPYLEKVSKLKNIILTPHKRSNAKNEYL